MRNSVRTSFAVFWASWADVLPIILDLFPDIGNRFFDSLADVSVCYSGQSSFISCLKVSSSYFYKHVWIDIPSWDMIRAGVRPPVPEPSDVDVGEWAHGWQFHGSNALELYKRRNLFLRLAFPL